LNAFQCSGANRITGNKLTDELQPSRTISFPL
jgi:hypothetical protein